MRNALTLFLCCCMILIAFTQGQRIEREKHVKELEEMKDKVEEVDSLYNRNVSLIRNHYSNCAFVKRVK